MWLSTIIEKLATIYKFLFQHLKELITICIFIGFLALFFYTSKEGVPFPLKISSLSVFLTILSFPIFLISSILPICIFWVYIFSMQIFTGIYPERKILSKQNLKIHNKLSGWFLIFSTIIFFLYFTPNKNKLQLIGLILLSIYISLRPVVSAYFLQIYKNKKERSFFAFTVLLNNAFSLCWAMFIITFTLIILSPFMENTLTAITIFSILAPIIFFSHFILTSPYYNIIRHLRQISIIYLTSLIFVMVTSVGHHFTKLSLKILKRGGGYSTTIYFDETKTKSLPNKIFTDKHKWRSKKAKVILDSLDYMYITLEDEPNLIFGIKSDLMNSNSIISKITDNHR